MIIGSILMFLSGGVFASGTSNFTILLVASVLGVISPSGNETGPFKSIEEAVLAKLTPPNHRPEIYAIHWVLAAAGSSIGSLCAGALIQTLTSKYEFSFARAYRTAFIFYCGISVVKATSMLFLSGKCEASYIPKFEQEQQQQIPELEHDAHITEEESLLINSSQQKQQQNYSSTGARDSSFSNDSSDTTSTISQSKIKLTRIRFHAISMGDLLLQDNIQHQRNDTGSNILHKRHAPIRLCHPISHPSSSIWPNQINHPDTDTMRVILHDDSNSRPIVDSSHGSILLEPKFECHRCGPKTDLAYFDCVQ
ncbi:unnamed protein product [Ambrosiozyma monospora]|uniref:Unnamed protein product n=1 Tax=Ambrosiozyma monospora TaxID=43982 RepID=A0ACB5U7N0_AMBMO|nr:unnamed protein product [Ambrosiozyma monospora]